VAQKKLQKTKNTKKSLSLSRTAYRGDILQTTSILLWIILPVSLLVLFACQLLILIFTKNFCRLLKNVNFNLMRRVGDTLKKMLMTSPKVISSSNFSESFLPGHSSKSFRNLESQNESCSALQLNSNSEVKIGTIFKLSNLNRTLNRIYEFRLTQIMSAFCFSLIQLSKIKSISKFLWNTLKLFESQAEISPSFYIGIKIKYLKNPTKIFQR
jgi:hypothetical protein